MTERLFWLSFCDPSRPAGRKFLGCAIVGGAENGDAVRRAWDLGCNPGGEVVSAEIAPEIAPMVGDDWRNRLLTRAEVDLFSSQMDAIARYL